MVTKQHDDMPGDNSVEVANAIADALQFCLYVFHVSCRAP